MDGADTVPPKKRIKDLQQSMIDAGFSPGALIYFAYETSKGSYNQTQSSCTNFHFYFFHAPELGSVDSSQYKKI